MITKKEVQFAFVRDALFPVNEAVIHVSDLAVQRGYGVFDFFKIKDGHPYFLQYHLDRFFQSAAIMKLTVPLSRAALTEVIHDLISKNQIDESGIKVILTGGYSSDGYQIAPSNLIITQHHLTLPTQDQTEKGISIITHAYNKEFPEAKTINYTMGIWLVDVLKKENAYDVLYHHNEVVSEFPRCNVFVVDQSGTVKTPASNILKGVTRRNILSLAGQKYKVIESDITRQELYDAQEVFLTSTTKRVLPIVEVDHKKIAGGNPGPVAMTLLEDLKKLESVDIKANSKKQ